MGESKDRWYFRGEPKCFGICLKKTLDDILYGIQFEFQTTKANKQHLNTKQKRKFHPLNKLMIELCKFTAIEEKHVFLGKCLLKPNIFWYNYPHDLFEIAANKLLLMVPKSGDLQPGQNLKSPRK